MKRLFLWSSLIFCFLLLASGAQALDVVQLTDNGTHDTMPAISGSNVVWVDYSNRIYLWDGSDLGQIGTGGNPAISGSNVAFVRHDGNDSEIFLWDGATTTQLTDNSTNDTSPDISGSNVVWVGSDYDIYLWDGASTTNITNDGVNAKEHFPRISGSNVVWEAGNEIYFWNGSTTTQITDNSYDDEQPAISGSNVVWLCYDGNDDEICLWDGVTTTNITDTNSVNEYRPDVSGSLVVWESGLEIHFWDGVSITNISNRSGWDGDAHISGSNVAWYGNDGNDSEIYTTDVLELLDEDGDEVINGEDNCIDDPNPDQCDFNSDGYGNRCDCDYDQDGDCGGGDYIIMSNAWGCEYPEDGCYDEQADQDVNEIVGGTDYVLFSNQWNDVMEGKSGLDCAGLTEGICAPVIGTCTAPSE